MTKLDSVVIEHLKHYAQYTAPDLVSSILERGSVQSDAEATALTDVVDAMYAHLDEDVGRGVVVFRQPVCAYDVDKVAEIVIAWLEEAGYEHVANARGY